jgi:hypothetical protein
MLGALLLRAVEQVVVVASRIDPPFLLALGLEQVAEEFFRGLAVQGVSQALLCSAVGMGVQQIMVVKVV